MNDTLLGAIVAGWLTMAAVGLAQVLAALGLQGVLWLIQHVRVTP